MNYWVAIAGMAIVCAAGFGFGYLCGRHDERNRRKELTDEFE